MLDMSVEVVESFYRCIEASDVEGMLATLAGDEFVGEVTAGLPGIGGVHRGAFEMLSRAWVPASELYRARVVCDEVVELADGRVVGLGVYTGRSPDTGQSFTASFAHVFTVEGGRITRLRQITDSASWIGASAAGEDPSRRDLSRRGGCRSPDR